MKHLLQQFLLTLLFIGVGFQVTAATVTWDGGAGTNNWTDAMNWDTDALPTTADDVDLAGSTVVLSTNTTVQRVYAGGSSDLTINAGVTLTITGFAGGDDGLEIQGSAMVTNNGTIDISSITGSAADGLYVKGTFINDGTVEIDGTGEYNIYVQGGNFTNNGTITITNFGISNSDRDGIAVDDNGGAPGTFDNDAGTITITMTSGDDGIYVNDGSTFNNVAMITISGAGGDNGIRVDDLGTFNNNLGGTLTINATPDDQILLDNTGLLNNTGSINLNNSADIGFFVTDESVFTNGATGTLTISNAGDNALYLDGNTTASTPYPSPNPIVNNSGTITINGSAGFDGIRLNESATLNNTGGTLDINNGGDEGIQIDAGCTINNSGTVDITSSFHHGMEAYGTFDNQTGSTFKASSCGSGDPGNLGDGIRLQSTGIFTNDGNIQVYDSGDNDIETTGSNFTNTGNATFTIGDPYGVTNIKKDFDLGSATVTFKIGGTTAGTEYDQIENKDNANTLTITGATAHLDWGSYIPAINDEFKIVDESGTVAGPFASVTSSNSDIIYTVDYSSNTDEVKIVVTNIVPVEMTYFKGNATAEGNLLQWETLSEQINEGFEVQKSIDGKNWEVIGFVEGNGTTIEVSNYEYLDENANEVNYYRLKQLDFDGAFEYSKTILMSNEATEKTTEKATVRTYPNPVTNQLTIEEFKGMVTIYNILGQPLKTFNVTNDVTSLPLSDLENGQYFIEMKANDGTKTVRQIVKIAE